MKVLAKIDPALYGGLTKILSYLAQNKESIDSLVINSGKITDATDTGFIYADLSSLFGDNSIEFLDPKYSVKLMRLLKGGSEFAFIDDEDNNKYVITNIISSISIAKAANKKQPASIPQFDQELSSREIETDIVNNIIEAQKTLEAEKVTIELDQNNNFVAVNINDNYEHVLDVDIKNNPDTQLHKFYVFDLMPIKGDGYEYKILKRGDETWIKVVIDLSIVEVEYYEKLVPAGEFDAFSLI